MALLPAFDPSRINTYSIGFDRMFDSLTSSTGYEERQHTYPPYNIIKVSDTEYIIELAVAGFAKNDIEIRMIADKLSINSILRSSVDSCNHLDIDRKSPNGSQVSESTKKSNWQ